MRQYILTGTKKERDGLNHLFFYCDFCDRLKNFNSLNYVDFLAVADGLSLRELKEIGFNLSTVPFGIGFNEDKKFVLLPNEFHFSYEED